MSAGARSDQSRLPHLGDTILAHLHHSTYLAQNRKICHIGIFIVFIHQFYIEEIASMQAGQPRATEAFSSFTVRPLPSSAILEGAFRVHIGSRDLEGLRLKPGDLCNLATQDGNIGTGIAWRSIEQNTKAQSHPVKLSDTIRDAFGFKLGNQMTISRASKPIAHVDRVTIIDVSDNDAVDASRDDGSWKWECGQTLCKCIHPSRHFDAFPLTLYSSG